MNATFNIRRQSRHPRSLSKANRMEKFSNWRDKGTGISPFIPVPSPTSQQNALVTYLLSPLIALVKLPIFILLAFIQLITPSFISVPVLRTIATIVFSLRHVSVSVQGFKRTNVSAINSNKPQPGQLILSNFVSPLDPVIFHLITKSTTSINFLIPYDEKVYVLSTWQAINFTFQPPRTTPQSFVQVITSSELAQFIRKNPQSVHVYFVEGTPSNNRAILPLQLPTITASDIPIKVSMLRLSPAYLTLPIPTISRFAYLYRLLSLSKGAINVRICNLDQVTSQAVTNAFSENSFAVLSHESMQLPSKQKFYHYYVDYKVARKRE